MEKIRVKDENAMASELWIMEMGETGVIWKTNLYLSLLGQ